MDNLRIDSVKRNKEVNIIIDEKKIIAYEGETLLAVMIASGIKMLRKSAVLKEPRGGLCGMGVCYDCIVKINGVSLRACMSYVKDGMVVKTND